MISLGYFVNSLIQQTTIQWTLRVRICALLQLIRSISRIYTQRPEGQKYNPVYNFQCHRELQLVLWWPKWEGNQKKRAYIYIYIYFFFLSIHFAVQQKLTRRCKATISSAQFSRSVVSDSLWPRGLQHARLPCPSPTPGACSNSRPLSQWCIQPSIPQ